MNEHLWFFLAFTGGVAGGIGIGWSCAHRAIRQRLHRNVGMISRKLLPHRSSDVHDKGTLDCVPPVQFCPPTVRLGKTDLPGSFWTHTPNSN